MIQKTKKIIITRLRGINLAKYIFHTVAAIIVYSGSCFAQEKDKYGFNELNVLFHAHKHETLKYTGNREKPKNEMEFLLAVGFNFYKTFFSSQDNPSCVFHPSCSSYSVHAFQQKGVIVGTLSTFDRLSRCHQFVKTNQYFYDPTKQRFYDPVK